MPLSKLIKAADRVWSRITARTKHDDRDIVFFMPVFKDAPVAFAALSRIRRFYPTSRVVLLSDGDPSFPGAEAAEKFGVEYILADNAYAISDGGRLIHRMLTHYMQAPAKYLLRIDTDARLDRRFAWLPGRTGLYGRIGERSGTAQGGCVLFTHDAAAKLFGERTFESPKLLQPETSWGRFSTPENLQRKLAQGRIAYDKVLHWGCVEAGVPVRPFGEIFSLWLPKPEHAASLANADRRYAVVHPDKEMTSLPN